MPLPSRSFLFFTILSYKFWNEHAKLKIRLLLFIFLSHARTYTRTAFIGEIRFYLISALHLPFSTYNQNVQLHVITLHPRYKKKGKVRRNSILNSDMNGQIKYQFHITTQKYSAVFRNVTTSCLYVTYFCRFINFSIKATAFAHVFTLLQKNRLEPYAVMKRW